MQNTKKNPDIMMLLFFYFMFLFFSILPLCIIIGIYISIQSALFCKFIRLYLYIFSVSHGYNTNHKTYLVISQISHTCINPISIVNFISKYIQMHFKIIINSSQNIYIDRCSIIIETSFTFYDKSFKFPLNIEFK